MKTSPCYPSRDQQASLYRGRGIQLPVLPRKKAKKKASYPQGNPHVSGKGIQLPVLRHDKSHSRGKTGEDAGKGIQLPVLLEKKSPHSYSRRCGRPTVRVVYRYPPALFPRTKPAIPTNTKPLQRNQQNTRNESMQMRVRPFFS